MEKFHIQVRQKVAHPKNITERFHPTPDAYQTQRGNSSIVQSLYVVSSDWTEGRLFMADNNSDTGR